MQTIIQKVKMNFRNEVLHNRYTEFNKYIDGYNPLLATVNTYFLNKPKSVISDTNLIGLAVNLRKK